MSVGKRVLAVLAVLVLLSGVGISRAGNVNIPAFETGIRAAFSFIDTAYRPVDLNPGTVITTTSNGMWVITAGSYHRSPSESEGVVVFLMQGKYFMSFQSTGAVVEVEWLSVPSPITWRSGESDQGGGWKWLDWFGYYSTASEPWIYHQEHQWLYSYDDGAGGVFFWYNDMQEFVRTTPTTCPYLYRFGGSPGWLWYQKGSANPRWFYNCAAGAWEQLP